MKKLTLTSNPTREEIIQHYRHLTIQQALRLFIKSYTVMQDRIHVKMIIRLLGDTLIFPINKKPHGSSYRVEDFIYAYDHNAMLDRIDTQPEFETYRIDCINVYSDFIAFLNHYLADLLKSYGYQLTENA